jgi:formylglycine-generating enzyme required for sulfatase activity
MKARAIRFAVIAFVAASLGAPVHAAAPGGRYTISGGTVSDSKTKLTWQQAAPATLYSWSDAKTYCASATVSSALGGSGWRLPTVKELLTILDDSLATGPLVDATAFPGTPSAYFWSTTVAAGTASSAWQVDFASGNTGGVAETMTRNVRCVR